eukprot:scaffold15585_cov50-Prasinocladus_malaysianus.AAC.1
MSFREQAERDRERLAQFPSLSSSLSSVQGGVIKQSHESSTEGHKHHSADAQDDLNTLASPQPSSNSLSTPACAKNTFRLTPFLHFVCITVAVQSTHSVDEESSYFFYQLHDGQWAFLHPLNFFLRMMFPLGRYSNFPRTLESRVLEVENMIQSDAMRRKLKYLQHLPLSASFQFLELDLSSILSSSALKPFESEIAARAKRRKKRHQAILRAAAKEANAAELERQSRKGPNIQDCQFQPLPAKAVSSHESPSQENMRTRDESADNGPAVLHATESSFASITRMGLAAAANSPALSGVPAPVGSPPLGCWAQQAAAAHRVPVSVASSPWDALPVATTQSDALDTGLNTNGLQARNGGRRKKGKKATVLYSTAGSHRRY